jgi:hypothetical protein
MSKRRFKVGDVVEFTEEYANFPIGYTFKVDEIIILKNKKIILISYSPVQIAVWASRVKLCPQSKTKLGSLW